MGRLAGVIAVPNHPYASYGTETDRFGRYWIHLACKRCGDRTKKQCSNPARTNYWIVQYGRLHIHR